MKDKLLQKIELIICTRDVLLQIENRLEVLQDLLQELQELENKKGE